MAPVSYRNHHETSVSRAALDSSLLSREDQHLSPVPVSIICNRKNYDRPDKLVTEKITIGQTQHAFGQIRDPNKTWVPFSTSDTMRIWGKLL